jgi:hypothetical protein
MNEGCMTIIFLGIVLILMIGVSCIMENIQCSQTGGALNYKTEWHYWTGCVVTKPNGSRVLLKQMRDMER